ncbi:MAG: CT253 family lipoprotein [Chlamydiales bacterium]
MRPIIAFCALLMMITGCQLNVPSINFRYYDDGREKPIVTLIPMFNRIDLPFVWDIATELTDQLRNDIQKKGSLFLSDEETSRSITSSLSDEEQPFSKDFSWIKNFFQKEQFIVFLELVEHEVSPQSTRIPFSQEVKSTYLLKMLVRARIIDLRSPKPSVILQEFIRYSHKIPLKGLQIDYEKNCFGTPNYSSTPIAVGHRGLCKEIAKRLEDYILLAKSK